MSKKKTPPEKKEATYTKDHYAPAWGSPQAFRKTWKKKKQHLNRVLRRKSENLLHAIEKLPDEAFDSEAEELSRELFRKGLIRKKLRKVGVISLREKVESKKQVREARLNRNERSRLARNAGYRKFLLGLVEDKEYSEANLVSLSRVATLSHFREFLHQDPSWVPKLNQWLLSARRRIMWRQRRNKS